MFLYCDADGVVVTTLRIEKHLAPEGYAAEVADDADVHPMRDTVIDGVWISNPPTREEMTEAVNAERDRRLPLAFEFNGALFDRDPVSVARISGAGVLALGAMVNGAQPGDLRWHGGASDFGWISFDGSVVPMDAQTVFQFGQAAAQMETRLVFAAKSLKSMDPIPDDFDDDRYWP